MKLFIFNDRIETLCSDLLVVCIYSDERPLKGLSGFVDWRLNSKISKLIIDSHISGTFAESTIFSPHSKMKVKRLLVQGIGEKSAINEIGLKRLFHHMFETIERLHLNDFAISLSRFVTANLNIAQVTTLYFNQLSEYTETATDFPKSNIIVVDDEMELHWLANNLKKLDHAIPMSLNIEVMQHSVLPLTSTYRS